ncbi:hypothetical protein KR009_001790 [Drosophila setifemur]|nr:hypothetical protein KR009_001790 [Drosophila setifemur]
MTNLNIETLQSFLELTEEDQARCKELFRQPLPSKLLENKYIKFTKEILRKFPNDDQRKPCFLAFQTISLHFRYSALIFSLCGIFENFHLVLYAAVLDDGKLPEKAEFIGNVLVNLLHSEIPKLNRYPLMFILHENNNDNQKVMEMLNKMENSVCNEFLFITDSGYWRNSDNPYAQNAWYEILTNPISVDNLEEIFARHRTRASSKNLDYLEQFVNDYYLLAKILITSRSNIILRLCTLERLDDFEKIIRSHMTVYKERLVTRKLIFQLLRALIVIYDR